MVNKYLYAIIRSKTGKLITESERPPVFWNKTSASYRAKDFIGVKVVRITHADFMSLINNTPK